MSATRSDVPVPVASPVPSESEQLCFVRLHDPRARRRPLARVNQRATRPTKSLHDVDVDVKDAHRVRTVPVGLERVFLEAALEANSGPTELPVHGLDDAKVVIQRMPPRPFRQVARTIEAQDE